MKKQDRKMLMLLNINVGEDLENVMNSQENIEQINSEFSVEIQMNKLKLS